MTAVIDTPLFSEDIPDLGASKGHVRFTLKSATPEDIALTGFCANVAASLLFERLQAQGTNLVFNLGKTSRVDILARYENDGLNLQWTPKTVDIEALTQTQERIRNKTFYLEKKTEKKEEKIEKKETPVKESEHMTEEQEDYLIKQLQRIP